MIRQIALTALLLSINLAAQFEVATIKPADHGKKPAASSPCRAIISFIAKNYTVRNSS